MGTRKNGRARRRHARGERVSLARPFSLSLTTSKHLLRRLSVFSLQQCFAHSDANLVRKLGFRVSKVAFNLNVFASFSIAHNNAKRKRISSSGYSRMCCF